QSSHSEWQGGLPPNQFGALGDPGSTDPGSRFDLCRLIEFPSKGAGHSTVTLLARLRGLSISQPRRRATWEASNLSGTTARSGWTTSGASGMGRNTSDRSSTD